MQPRAAIPLAFLSGFVALGYEILWARRLADVIGATALASSLVVGVFFVMLAAGAVALGPRAARAPSPWRLYAGLEGGIVVAMLPAFFGVELAHLVAGELGATMLRPGASLGLKALLALLFVGPASFLMGGTLPAMGQAVVRAGRLGREGNVLYGTNTLGGAAGILVTTFALSPALGVRRSFLVLMAGSLLLAGAALRLAVRARRMPANAAALVSPADCPGLPNAAIVEPAVSPSVWGWVAFASGLNVLGLEILALHLFSQVLHNSTYTFATVLVVVIAALAVGALVTQRWQLTPAVALHRTALALLTTALATALVPRLFVGLTHGMQPLGGGVPSLTGYVLRILGTAALVLGPSFVVAGWVFPLVLAGAGVSEGDEGAAAGSRSARRTTAVGTRWGRLLGVNAAGALLGMLVANFVCMRVFGLWLSLAVWSTLALVAGLLVATAGPAAGRRWRWGLALAAAAALVAGFPGSLPVTALGTGERLLAWRAGPDGIGAVVASGGPTRDRRIKWNNTYTLGGIANAAQQARMGQLVLLLHPRPERTGYIGIATGITASSALRDPAVQAVTAVELSPEITTLACEYFADANGDLCASPRVRVVVEDGRMFFHATRDRFDVIVGDLFVPWQAGTANLYTREQFTAVRDHLAPGGLFAQWLPLFQLDAVGFFGIATTFAAVFPNAWLAIADFQPYNPAVALVGWRDADGAPSAAVLETRCREVLPLERLREPMLADAAGAAAFLVGPLAGALPPGVPLLTLDRPWLADHAPRVQRARPERYFAGAPLVAYLQQVAAHCTDPLLLPHIQRGQQLYQYCEILQREGPPAAAAWFDAHVTAALPATNFAPPQPARLNWPFPRAAGMFLLQRAARGR